MSTQIYTPLTSVEDLTVGDSITTPGRSLYQSDIMAFCGMVGDANPLHVDEVEAARHPIGRIVAPATLVTPIAIGLFASTRWFSALLIAFVGMDRWKVEGPTFPGDRIDASVTVDEVTVTSDGQRRVITFVFDVFATRTASSGTERVKVMDFAAKFLAESPSAVPTE